MPRIRAGLDKKWLAAAGVIILLTFGTLFATTLFDDVSSELARRSDF